MHELSICGAIIDTVSEHAKGQPIGQVNLSIGHFRQIVPDTLQYCWNIRTDGTDLDGCMLSIRSIAAVIVCGECATSTTLDDPILRCGSCGSSNATMTSGDEFVIESIDLRTSEEPATRQRELS